MKFSVLMSLYHAEKPEFLHQCLNSLTMQTLIADEIVMVFDGYIPPDLEAIVQQFQAALNIKIVRLAENVGLGKALNIGLTYCFHEIILRMDTDDIALPNRFALQRSYLIMHPEIDLLGTQIAEFDTHDGNTLKMRIVPQSHLQIIEFSKKRNPFNHMTVAYKKSAVLQAGGYQHHVFMEDYNLWLRMLAKGAQTANLPDTLVLVRTGTTMIARRHGWKYVFSEWQLYHLKCSLHIQSTPTALYYFVVRSLPRLLPILWLQKIYLFIRK